MASLKNQVALITGASSGIGRAIARAFAREGARIAIGARRVDRLALLQKELGDDVDVWSGALDVRNLASVENFVAGAFKHFGAIDILVNNAGLALGREPLKIMNDKDFE